jgi:hypothetical protein
LDGVEQGCKVGIQVDILVRAIHVTQQIHQSVEGTTDVRIEVEGAMSTSQVCPALCSVEPGLRSRDLLIPVVDERESILGVVNLAPAQDDRENPFVDVPVLSISINSNMQFLDCNCSLPQPPLAVLGQPVPSDACLTA